MLTSVSSFYNNIDMADRLTQLQDVVNQVRILFRFN